MFWIVLESHLFWKGIVVKGQVSQSLLSEVTDDLLLHTTWWVLLAGSYVASQTSPPKCLQELKESTPDPRLAHWGLVFRFGFSVTWTNQVILRQRLEFTLVHRARPSSLLRKTERIVFTYCTKESKNIPFCWIKTVSCNNSVNICLRIYI